MGLSFNARCLFSLYQSSSEHFVALLDSQLPYITQSRVQINYSDICFFLILAWLSFFAYQNCERDKYIV